MNHYSKDLVVSWDEMHRQGRLLARRLLDKSPWKGIAAVTRGGLVPASIVARELGIRIVETICIASYDHQDQGKPQILKPMDALSDGEGWLVVDDLVDTGGTFKIIRDHLPKAHLAAVFAKPLGLPVCDTYITEVSQNTWIFQPWDMESQFKAPLCKTEKSNPA
jgi:xanthine phosphoribosyltransferase